MPPHHNNCPHHAALKRIVNELQFYFLHAINSSVQDEITPSGNIDDPHALGLKMTVNGKLVQVPLFCCAALIKLPEFCLMGSASPKLMMVFD